MRTAITPHKLLPKGLHLEGLSIETERVSIQVASGRRRSPCPVCGCGSSRVHSRYWRAISDLPWHGISVALEVRARRFFCDEASCERRIFCERLPEVAARARKTNRLERALLAIALELGGRAGARLARELGLLVGRDALLFRVKNITRIGAESVRVLGIDDFAFRKGDVYGTILVDLERHKIVDLLPERSTQSTADWLKKHPGVEIVSRDRSNVYAQGICEGAPGAAQVADRWHLLRSLALGLEEFLLQKGPRSGGPPYPKLTRVRRFCLAPWMRRGCCLCPFLWGGHTEALRDRLRGATSGSLSNGRRSEGCTSPGRG